MKFLDSVKTVFRSNVWIFFTNVQTFVELRSRLNFSMKLYADLIREHSDTLLQCIELKKQNRKAENNIDQLRAQLEIKGDFEALKAENERLRSRLTKTGMELVDNKKANASLKRQMAKVDVVDEIPESQVEQVKEIGGLEILKQKLPEFIQEAVSDRFKDRSSGYVVREILDNYAKTPNGEMFSAIVDSFSDVEIRQIRKWFPHVYVNFHNNYFDSICVIAALCDDKELEWCIEYFYGKDAFFYEVCEIANLVKSVPESFINILPFQSRTKKSNAKYLNKFHQLITYLTTTNTDSPLKDILKSFGISNSSANRFVYLTLFALEAKNHKDWRKVL